MTTYFERQLKEFEHSIHSMDMELFERWVDKSAETLKKGHKIIVSGLGKNVPVCEKFVGSMQSLGLDAYFLNTNSAVHGDMGVVKDGDMVIILTKSGETAESIYLTKLLKQRKADLWLLTFEKESTLTREIENCVVLDLVHEGDLWNIMPNNSTTINLIVLQGLAMKTAAVLGLGIEDFKRNHPGGAIGKALTMRDRRGTKMNGNEYYFISPFGLGDTMILCGLHKALMKKYDAPVNFVIKPSHEIIMKMYGITSYQIRSFTRRELEELKKDSLTPNRGGGIHCASGV